MNANGLDDFLKSGNACLLLNVLPEEVHAARRIPGSSNACVYETAFLEKVGQLAPVKDLPIVVYGAGGDSLDSKVAQEKLIQAGYSRVECYSDGIAVWEAADLPLEGDGNVPGSPILHGNYQIDVSASVIRWTGRNLFNQHYGTIRLASGEIVVRKGDLESAHFDIDMNSIACDDLADAQWNGMLLDHLKTADFFETERFPTATFIADRTDPLPSCSVGTPTHRLTGRFTLRGISRPLEFPVVIASADGKRLTGQGQFEIDRTEFGSIYGSGKFFRFLGKHVVNDLVHLDVMIHADLVA